MKHFLSIVILLSSLTLSAENIPAYFKSNTQLGSINTASKTVKNNITNAGYKIIGEYNPASNSKQKVIIFTNNSIKKLSLEFSDRGALGSILRIGLSEKNGKTTVSISNPYYVFSAYWGSKANASQKSRMKSESNKAVKILGNSVAKFGGEMSESDLAEYHYKMMMPYFTDPVELEEYSSFSEGVKKIDTNLKNGKGSTKLVYKLTFPGKNIVVYGVQLKGEDGEAGFLNKIGSDHIAAMPYEIILQGKEATMLHGKYRLALYWPNLTMSQFMTIMSTPGDIEDALEAVCE